jgi:hypothetical protein
VHLDRRQTPIHASDRNHIDIYASIASSAINYGLSRMSQ